MTIDTQRFAEAVRYAAELHATQTRKGGDGTAPYLCHLLIVSGQVLEYGGSEVQAIAALLHDAIEDCDDVDHAAIAERFGEDVAVIVSDCTDTLPGDTPEKKAPWRERKERYLEHLETASDASLLVAACLAPTAAFGAFVGAGLTHALPVRWVRVAFILLMVWASANMLGVV